tara:strand:+ start:138 stop:323 length:186 start_codon:yes stop_codon:yes gene_type:complete
MTNELTNEIQVIVKQQGGRLSEHLKPEFIKLCQETFQYRPDMDCGKCIYKHSVKLYNQFLK